MLREKGDFNAVAFKDEMQRRVERRLAGVSAEDRMRETRRLIESGPLGAWWASLSGKAISGKPSSGS